MKQTISYLMMYTWSVAMICSKKRALSEQWWNCFQSWYSLLCNIYEGILTSTSLMVACCQHACKRFALSVQLCSTAYNALFTNQYWCCMWRKMSLTFVHYCTLLSMAHHFDAHNCNTCGSHFVIKQAVKLNGFTP